MNSEVEKCIEGEYILGFKPVGVHSWHFVCASLDECRALCPHIRIVTVDELFGDAEASTLGEMVAALLLLPPEAILGDQSVYREAREVYLTRVALEEHSRLRRKLGSLADYALVAPHYHIVSRVSRLSRLYPWLAAAFTEALRRNPKSILEAGAESLEVLGCRGEHGWYRICDEEPRAPRGWRLLRAQLTRIFPIAPPGSPEHPLLADPLLLVRLKEGRLRTKILEFEEQLYTLTGVTRLLRRAGLGGTVSVYTSGFRSVVVKHYRTPAIAKWIVAVGVALPIYRYRLAPRDRMEAEYVAHVELRALGMPVPEPILIDIYGVRAAYEYIEGAPLHQLVTRDPLHPSLAEAAMLLAQLHSSGWVVGDANPSNFIVAKDRVYLVDLEQARRSDKIRHMAWDLAVLLYYSFLFNPHEPGNRAWLIAQAYVSAGGSKEVVREASKVVYAAPFTALAPINVIEKARRALQHLASLL